jgi:hypothetical protein
MFMNCHLRKYVSLAQVIYAEIIETFLWLWIKEWSQALEIEIL